MAAVGCVFRETERLTFVGVIPDSKVYVDHAGRRFVFVEWIVVDGDFHAFGFMLADQVSDKPYLAPVVRQFEIRRRCRMSLVIRV